MRKIWRTRNNNDKDDDDDDNGDKEDDNDNEDEDEGNDDNEEDTDDNKEENFFDFNLNDVNGMSEYELLRLRNVHRNNARLASLGLLEGMTSTAPPSTDRIIRKKRVAMQGDFVRRIQPKRNVSRPTSYKDLDDDPVISKRTHSIDSSDTGEEDTGSKRLDEAEYSPSGEDNAEVDDEDLLESYEDDSDDELDWGFHQAKAEAAGEEALADPSTSPEHSTDILSWKCRRHVATCRRRHNVSLQFWPDGSVSPTQNLRCRGSLCRLVLARADILPNFRNSYVEIYYYGMGVHTHRLFNAHYFVILLLPPTTDHIY
jgi:hypothetical protein